MLQFKPGLNVFDAPAQSTIIIPINTVGAMGKGVAGGFRKYFPDEYNRYHRACINGDITISTLRMVYPSNSQNNFLLFPTKMDWRDPSKLEWVRSNLIQLRCDYADMGITELWLPKLGCGDKTGQLDWKKDVRPIIMKYYVDIDIPVVVCE